MQTTLLLGSNQGNRQHILNQAIEKIETTIGNISSTSAVYQSKAHGYESTHPYLNQALVVQTTLTPHQLLKQTQTIENELGRTRDPNHRYSDRTIDIDILFYENNIIDTPELTIPHPRITERQFVLEPLKDIIPHYIHPQIGLTIREIWVKSPKN